MNTETGEPYGWAWTGITVCHAREQLRSLPLCGCSSRAAPELGTDTVMTEVDFWFLFGAASVSAAVIGFVCWLEVSYRLERQRRCAASIALAGLKTTGVAPEIAPQPPTTAEHSGERLRIACAEPKGEARIAHGSVHVASPKSTSSKRDRPDANATAVLHPRVARGSGNAVTTSGTR